MESFYAHIKADERGIKRYQSVEEHCRQTSDYAANAMKCVGLYHSAKLAGLIHDKGKLNDNFQLYLKKSSDGEKTVRGSVNHTFAGVRYLLEEYHGARPLDFESMTSEIIAYASGAHHGLFDCVDEGGRDGFLHRLKTEGIGYEEARENFLRYCCGEAEIEKLFQKSVAEITEKLNCLYEISRNNAELSFYGGLLTRLLLSAVIDGDRRDTAEFMLNIKYADYPDDMGGIWKERLDNFLKKLDLLPNNTPIQMTRRRFSELSAKLAEKPAGIYRLSLPTGAGKTLSSLRAALACAAKQNKRRIIYAIPLLSILDQNAEIIRKYIDDDSLILEHHSNVITEKDSGKLDKLELLEENWSRPVVITTLVQLLNTLFDGRTSCIRRMQALCGGVLVIDEVQSVPVRLLSLFNLAMNFLAKVCNTTVLLCSATQPCLENTAHSLYCTPDELVPYSQKEWEIFRRTRIGAPRDIHLSEIGQYLISELSGSTLIVCNTKREASEIYAQLDGIEKYHLSASMCMAHRRRTLGRIERALAENRSFVCVSTQLIEAGVDLSFKKAVRIMAGLDSILQTAGRCNRNGESAEPAEVTVLRCRDERLTMLKDIKAAQNASEELFEAFSRSPESFRCDLMSDEAVRFYYKSLYSGCDDGEQDGCEKGEASLYSLLSDNEVYAGKCATAEDFWLRQAFAEAGRRFEVFDRNTVDVVVPYGEGREIIADLCSEKAERDLSFLAEAVKRAKPFAVSVFGYQRDILIKQGGITEKNGVYIINDGWYDDVIGLITDEPKLDYEEV